MPTPEEHLTSLLTAVEPAEVAEQDAVLLISNQTRGGPFGENAIRVRLHAITAERGLGPDDLDEVWEFLRLEKGPPRPFTGGPR